MKRSLLLTTLISFCFTAFAQQDPLYSQYINNPFVINPAYTGLTNNLSATLSYRQQWSGFDGSPKTFNANGHISLMNNRMGAGAMLVSDHIGNTTINEVYGSYAYHINLSTDKILSFGLQGGFANYQIDNSKVNPYDKSDPFFMGNYSQTKPTLGAGVILKSDKFFIGLSVPRMLSASFDAGGLQSSLYTQHFYGMASYFFTINERITFKPSVLLKGAKGVPLSADVNASVIFLNNYSAGILTRNFNTYGLFAQIQLKDLLRIGYVFEVPTSKSVGANFTTNEITLGIRLATFTYHNTSTSLNTF